MEIKKFYATSLPAAMRDIRRTLGPDAVILGTRSLPPNTGILLTDGRATVEITAGRETQQTASQQPAKAVRPQPQPAAQPAPNPLARFAASQLSRKQPSAPERKTNPLVSLINEVKELKTLLDAKPRTDLPRPKTLIEREVIQQPPANNQNWEDIDLPRQSPAQNRFHITSSSTTLSARLIQKRLLEQGVDPIIIKRIIERMHFAPSIEKQSDETTEPGSFSQFVQVVEGFIPRNRQVCPNGSARKIALIAPTGVGKTTTIAKLASIAALQHNRQVALITLDTYRIAAADQLKTYARLLGVPLEVVSDPDQLQRSIDRFSDAEDIYIDTPGYSPRDTASLQRLAASFRNHPDIEMHLLITCSTRFQEMRQIIERFLPIGFDRLLFTKLDEATAVGDLLNTWIMAGYPVSYFTTGQRVPEDLEEALADSFCRRLLTPVE